MKIYIVFKGKKIIKVTDNFDTAGASCLDENYSFKEIEAENIPLDYCKTYDDYSNEIKVKNREIIERVASGLREMGQAPDAFFCCLEPLHLGLKILQIPIFYCDYDLEFTKCPFIPIWRNIFDGKNLVEKFFIGYNKDIS
jgi:hypothetical protein